ncbi:MAG TPA: hypothetical protein ENI85_05770 [Deltaproteobacteria bacterium]|nr:hypothetical protein [Deltaproteobacteria bacterium]
MSIETSIDPDGGFAHHVATGAPTAADFISALQELYADPRHAPEKGGIWDLRRVDSIGVTTEDMLRIVEHIRETRGPQPGRTALVVGRDVEFGLGRMYQAYSESVVTFRVFRDWEAALAWITQEPRPEDQEQR